MHKILTRVNLQVNLGVTYLLDELYRKYLEEHLAT